MTEHLHDFMFTTRWCRVCSVAERDLYAAPRTSILWQECYLGEALA